MTSASLESAALLRKWLSRCVELEASDLHLAPQEPPRYRVHGVLSADPQSEPLPAEITRRVAQTILRMAAGDELGCATSNAQSAETAGHDEFPQSVDGAFTSEGVRYRFNTFATLRGIGIAIRRLEDRFQSLAELGLPDSLYELCDLPDGLVLFAGPTGAGKSTTLASLIDRINRTRPCHVITIEDPIEYVHVSDRALVAQRQVGAHTPSFNAALVNALREDPDVILLGEVRDLETIRTVLRAAETGHLVFATVHAADTVGAIERFTAVFPAEEQIGIRTQLALVLRAIVAQRLLPGAALARSGERGLRRRVVASEILINTPAVAHLISSARSSQIYSALETGSRLGMQSFEQDLARLLAERSISPEVAHANARAPELLRGQRDSARTAPSRTRGGEV